VPLGLKRSEAIRKAGQLGFAADMRKCPIPKNPNGALATQPKSGKFVEPREAPVSKPTKNMFDPKAFLAKVGAGKTILEFRKHQHVFEQGDVADTAFYIQKGKVKLTVGLSRARKRSSQF